MSDREAWGDKDKIDDALKAWPEVRATDEEALATKTMNRIRANFPPKSKLTLTDDALVGSPLPATGQDAVAAVASRPQTKSIGPADDTLKVTAEAARAAEAAADQAEQTGRFTEIGRAASERTPREPSAEATPHREPKRETEREPEPEITLPTAVRENSKKSSQIDVPIGRASSIPPPSSGVARSERSAAPPVRETSQSKAEGSMGQVERQRDRTSFKDLAKLAATPPPPSAKPSSAKVPVATPSSSSGLKSDSGVVDLQAAALSDPHGAERAKSTPLASGSLFDEDGPASGRASVSPPSMSGEHLASGPMSAVPSVPQQIDPYSPASVRPSVPPAALSAGRISAVPVSAGPHSAVAALQPAKKESKSRVGLILGSLVSVGAIAAGAFFFIRTHHPVAAAPDKAPVAANAANNTTPPSATQPAAVAAQDQTATPAATDTVSPDALAVSDAQNGAKSAGKPIAKKSAGKPVVAMKEGNSKVEVDTPSAPPQVAKTEAKDEAPPAVGGSASLQDAMKTAAGPADTTNTQAAPTGPKFAPGSVPQRPSQGALSSAIGRSLPDARACLGPDDGVSYANVVFESSGGVQNVTLSGFAAGKPAGACITAALKKASVGPFAEATYSAKVTVRP